MLDHLEDIESDMSAIHRIDDIHAVSARRFFALVPRLPAYPGVMQVRVQAELENPTETLLAEPSAPPPTGGKQGVPDRLARVHAGFAGDGGRFPPAIEVGGGGS